METRARLIAGLLALVLAALSLAPSYTHLLEAQPRLEIWSPELWREATVLNGQFRLFAIVGAPLEMATLAFAFLHAWLLRREKRPFHLAGAGALLYLLRFVTWLLWVAPANSVMATWAAGPIPGNFESIRLRWETGHMAIAAIKLVGFILIALSVLIRLPRGRIASALVEIAASDQHVAVWGQAAVAAAMGGAVAPAMVMREVAVADGAEEVCQILQPIGDDVDDIAFLLERALHSDHRRRHDDPPMGVEDALPEDGVGDAGLVLQGDEGHIALARLLADEHDPRHLDLDAILEPGEVARPGDAAAVELGPEEAQRMIAKRELNGAVILDDLPPICHRPQRDRGLALGLARIGCREQGQHRLAQSPYLPQRLPPAQPETGERIRIGQLFERRHRDAGAEPHILDRGEGPVAPNRHDLRGMDVGEPPHHAQTEAEG
jgi:hypothetical protein